MRWTVLLTAKADRQARKLPERIRARLLALMLAMEATGPMQPGIPHFGRLKGWPGEVWHCHLNKGRPTYVAIWRAEADIVTVEVFYAGTHENAPY